MKIKIIIFIVVFGCISATDLSAQPVNIWDITNKFLVENGYKSQADYSRPTKIKENYIVQPYFIFGLGGEINNPDFIIPNHDKLDSYSFGSIFRPHYMHLLYVKAGKWRIIDMGKPLPDIIMQGYDLCKDFGLDDNESVFVIEDVIRHYEWHLEELASLGHGPTVLYSSVIKGSLPMLSFERAANVRNIAYDFLVENGYAKSDNGATVIEKGDICIRYNDSDISDSEFALPKYNVLQFLSFGIAGESTPMHLMFFKAGKWRIADMSKPLPDIVMQCHNLCEDLCLNGEETASVFRTAVEFYKTEKR